MSNNQHGEMTEQKKRSIMEQLWLDYYNGQRAHSTLGNQSPQMYTEAAGMTLEPHFLRDFYAAERHLSLRSSPSQSSGSRSYAPNSLKKWLALHRPA